mgnify:FL=1
MEIYPMKNNNLKTLFKKKFVNPFPFLKRVIPEKSINPDCIKDINEDQMLIENIESAKNEWINADLNFQYVSENEFVEYYTYKLKAAQIRYEFFLKKAKEKGLKVNIGNCTINTNTELSVKEPR